MAETNQSLESEIRHGHREWIVVPERDHSPEHDYGANWRLARPVEWDGRQMTRTDYNWRVSWIENTGELYAVNLQNDDEYILIAVIHDEQVVDKGALKDWVDIHDLAVLIQQARPYHGKSLADLPELRQAIEAREAERQRERERQPSNRRPRHWATVQPPDLEKVYVGQRPGDADTGDSMVFVERPDHPPYKLRPVMHHTRLPQPGVKAKDEYGVFEWGYAGSGPSDTALSMLRDFFGEQPSPQQLYYGMCRCWHYHQPFKEAFLATAPTAGFRITARQIADWLAQQPEPDVE